MTTDKTVLIAVPYVELVSDEELDAVYAKLDAGHWGEGRQPGEKPRMFGFARAVIEALQAT